MDENTRQMDGRPVTGSRALLLLTFENMLCSCLVFTSSGLLAVGGRKQR